jgi:hypothetical protein
MRMLLSLQQAGESIHFAAAHQLQNVGYILTQQEKHYGNNQQDI